MIHDPDILDYSSGITPQTFEGEVFRATRKNLDPRTPSLSGGRWFVKGETAALYTSLEREGVDWHAWGTNAQKLPSASQPR